MLPALPRVAGTLATRNLWVPRADVATRDEYEAPRCSRPTRRGASATPGGHSGTQKRQPSVAMMVVIRCFCVSAFLRFCVSAFRELRRLVLRGEIVRIRFR